MKKKLKNVVLATITGVAFVALPYSICGMAYESPAWFIGVALSVTWLVPFCYANRNVEVRM